MSKANSGSTGAPIKGPSLWRIALWAIIPVVLIPVLAVAALHIPYFQKEIIGRAVNRIEAATSFKIGIESFRWWPFSRLYLSNVTVQSDGREILNCGRARVTYSLSASWPYVEVEEVYLQKPFLRLDRNAEGKWLVPSGKSGPGGEPSGEQEPFWATRPLPKLHIDSGTVEARLGDRQTFSAKNITGTVHLKHVSGRNGPELRLEFDKWEAETDSSPWGKWAMSGSFAYEGGALASERIQVSNTEGTSGALSGKWNVHSPYDGAAQIEVSSFSASGIPGISDKAHWLSGATGQITVTRQESGEWSVEHDLATSHGSLQGVLKIARPESGPWVADWTTRFQDLTFDGAGAVAEPHLYGQIETTTRFDEEKILQVVFNGSLDPSRAGSETIQSGDFHGLYERGTLIISGSSIRSSLVDMRLTAVAGIEALWNPERQSEVRAEIQIDKCGLDKINPKMQQRLGGSVKFEGRSPPGELRNLRLWQAKMEANLNIPDLVSLKASGSYQDETLKLDYDLSSKDVQRFSSIFPQWQGRGALSSKGSFSGKLSDLLWEGEISSPRFLLGEGQADQLTMKGKGRIAGKEAQRELQFKAQSIQLGSRRAGPVNGRLEQKNDVCSFDLQGDGVLSQFSLKLSGRAERIWDFPQIVVAAHGQIGWKDQNGALDCRVEVEKEGVKVQSASIQQGKQRMQLAGDILWDSRTDLKVSFESVNLAHWLSTAMQKEVLTGALSGTVQVSGRPEQPECSLSLQVVNGVLAGKHAIDKITIQGSYARDLLNVQGEGASPATQPPAAFTAKIPLHFHLKPFQLEVSQAEEWSTEIKVASFDAGALLPHMDYLTKVGGQIQGEIHGSGSFRQPVVRGGGTLKDAFFVPKAWPHATEHLQGEWTADAKQINVTRGEGTLLGGRVSVTGWIDWPRFKTMSFSATGTDLQVPDMYGIQGKVSAEGEVRQTPDTADVTGTLRFSNAEMNLGRLETNIAQNIQIVETNSQGDLLETKDDSKNPFKFANRLRMEVALVLPPSGTWVTGKGLKAEIVGDLRLEKARGGPVRLLGELQALKGTYTFQGQELKISEGSLVFTGSTPPDPRLKIMCERQDRDVILQVLVSGPLSQPKMILSSLPSMNQVDILSYLFFGHPATELSSKENSQLQMRAAGWLGSETSKALKQALGNNPLTPDTFQYKTTSKLDKGFVNNQPVGSTTANENQVIEIGKYITPDLYVNYGRGVSGVKGGENQVEVEYRMNRHLSIQTQVGGTDQSGVDIFWRHDFGK